MGPIPLPLSFRKGDLVPFTQSLGHYVIGISLSPPRFVLPLDKVYPELAEGLRYTRNRLAEGMTEGRVEGKR